LSVLGRVVVSGLVLAGAPGWLVVDGDLVHLHRAGVDHVYQRDEVARVVVGKRLLVAAFRFVGHDGKEGRTWFACRNRERLVVALRDRGWTVRVLP
jgi:hypothetical protein